MVGNSEQVLPALNTPTGAGGHQYREGDLVKVVANASDHFFAIGDIVEITSLNMSHLKASEQDYYDLCAESEDGTSWYMSFDDIEPFDDTASNRGSETKVHLGLGNFVKIKTAKGAFSKGDMAEIVAYDPDCRLYRLAQLDGDDANWVSDNHFDVIAGGQPTPRFRLHQRVAMRISVGPFTKGAYVTVLKEADTGGEVLVGYGGTSVSVFARDLKEL